jgi:PleD family two-component response regulator
MENIAPKEERKSILLVDDTPANLHLLTKILTTHDYQVRATVTGDMALTTVKSAPPDLILLDIFMPNMNGYEVCQHLKADELTKDIPIIFISAVGEVVDKIKAFEVGGVDYITKPFHVAELLAKVKTYLTINHLKQQIKIKDNLLKQEKEAREKLEAALAEANQKIAQISLTVEEN